MQYRLVRPFDCGVGWPVVGLGPVVVAGSFDMPSGVFALDESRVRSSPSDGVESSADQRDGMRPAVVSGLRGKNRAPQWSGARYEGQQRN